MKIQLQFKLSEFYYSTPITILKKTINKNQVLNIIITNDNQKTGEIDLISLPSFHQYNLSEWKYFLENFFKEIELDLDNIEMSAPGFNMIKNAILLDGELLFIIESILFKIIEELKPDALAFISKNPIQLNGLYNKLQPLLNYPDCLKIKIRPEKANLLETTELLKAALAVKPNIKFRLDGNRTFDLIGLANYLEKIVLEIGSDFIAAIDYIEEPFIAFSEIYKWKNFKSIPIAIDESLIIYKNNLNALLKFSQQTVLIVKPSLLGISKSFEISVWAYKNTYRVVISSSYEPATTFRPLMYLAAFNPLNFHGLDTLKFLPKELTIDSENYSLNF